MAESSPARQRPDAGKAKHLDALLLAFKEGNEPERAAAELAQHMRHHGLANWRDMRLVQADAIAGRLLYCSHIYQGGRHWHQRATEPSWNSGDSMLVLFTPSVERGLVLRFRTEPRWSPTNIGTGLHYMPRHPESGAFTTLEAHRHDLPTDVRPHNMASYSWEGCCARDALDPELSAKALKLVAASAPIDAIRDEMFVVWQKIFPAARASWKVD